VPTVTYVRCCPSRANADWPRGDGTGTPAHTPWQSPSRWRASSDGGGLRPAGASRGHDTHRLDAMAPGLVGQTIEQAASHPGLPDGLAARLYPGSRGLHAPQRPPTASARGGSPTSGLCPGPAFGRAVAELVLQGRECAPAGRTCPTGARHQRQHPRRPAPVVRQQLGVGTCHRAHAQLLACPCFRAATSGKGGRSNSASGT
jgi:hypothetical protein